MAATGAQIDSARMSQANAAQDLLKAPIDRARAAQALRVDQALQDATIRKGIADAGKAEVEELAARIKARYPEMSESQALASARYVNMDEGNKLYEGALKKGYKPDALGNKLTFMLEKIPGFGQETADWIRSPMAEQAALGERVYKAGQLRAETGAGDRATEGPDVRTRTFPSPFTTDSPERREQLRRIRQEQIAVQRRIAGPGAEPQLPPGLTPAGARAQAKAAIARNPTKRAAVLERLKALGVDTTGL